MSVIVKNQHANQYLAYVKGSPEKIASLCNQSSLPADYLQTLEIYTQKGYRVIALARKQLGNFTFMQIQKIKRDRIERDLHFLGFLIMENKLKPATQQTIATLNSSKIRTIMATGDNTLTAISVGRECNILDKNQEVFFGDVVERRLVWKSSKVLDERVDTLQANDNDDHEIEVADFTKNVPWDGIGGKDFGVALNGSTLAFLNKNKKTYAAVLHKVLFKA
jgi:cation-transporting ATPase 13A2